MKYILLCGGLGSRYNNYSLPKPLNYINGKHMIEFTIENIPSDEIYIIYNIFLDEYMFKEIVINLFKKKTFYFACIEYTTRGAVESAYIGIQQFSHLFDINENIVFIDNDNLYKLQNVYKQEHFETDFIGYGIDTTDKSNYSFIQFKNENDNENENYIYNIEEKKKISNYFCCGLYGFKNATHFTKYSKELLHNNIKTNNEFYFSQLYKFIIQQQELIKPIFIEKTQHIGSYKEIINNKLEIDNPKLRICFDLDNTLVTYPTIINDYTSVKPIIKNINLLNILKNKGHEIIIYTARRMKSHNNNIGKVIKDIALITINTLEKYNIPYDELIFGKPIADIYIDDKSINPFLHNISYFGFFNNTEEFLPNKTETNKNNSISFINNNIIKTGPFQFMRGELYYYNNIPLNLSYLFPKLINGFSLDKYKETNTMTFEIEYIKGIPLFYLYKNNLITSKIMNDLFNILNILHTQKINENNFQENDLQITEINVRNNYFEKIKKRFENKEDYYFEDSEIVYNEIIEGLNINYNADIKYCIHGDFWFSNIIMLYDDTYKLIDMKGQVDGILTISGDCYYDYGKLYQSIIGYDLILNDIIPDTDNLNNMNVLFIQKCIEIGLNVPYLKYVTKSLIFGSFAFIDKSEKIKKNIWNLLKSI